MDYHPRRLDVMANVVIKDESIDSYFEGHTSLMIVPIILIRYE
jgi:hypothetical protein